MTTRKVIRVEMVTLQQLRALEAAGYIVVIAGRK